MVRLRRNLKRLHSWVGLGVGAILAAILSTGFLLEDPSARVPGAGREVLCLAADPFRAGRFFRGTSASLEVSEDGGASWSEVPMAFPPMEAVGVSFHPARPGTLAVLQRRQGPILSRDGGTVWEALELPFDPLARGVDMRSLSFDGAGVLFVHTSRGTWAWEEGTWREAVSDPSGRDWAHFIRGLHSGRIFGAWGVRAYEATSFALLFLILSGIVLWRMKSY